MTNKRNRSRARSNRNLNNTESKDFVAIRDEDNDGYIVLKQESLYRPLLIVFAIQIFVMAIIFPNIFDDSIPAIMNQIRNIVKWMVLSATGTLLPIPGLSPSDYVYIPMVLDPLNSDLSVFLTGLLIVASDVFFAFLGYKFTNTLRKVFMSKRKQKDEEKVNARFKKYGNIAMLVGAATPLPFTLMVYTAGALKLPRKSFLIAIFIGRSIKYTALALPIRLFNFDLAAYGEKLYADLLSGDLNMMHYILMPIVLGGITWFVTSILKSVKEYKKNKIEA